MNIEIISASAGSGKTYRLATVLEEALSDGSARPEAVLATTFTRKAAAELQERARRRLLEDGRIADAERLGAARIGTVNSVCGRIVTDFAFELGLSPELDVLDENAEEEAVRRSLSHVITSKDLRIVEDLASRLPKKTAFSPGWDWQDHVNSVIRLARTNRIGPARFDECARRSAREIIGLLGKPLPRGEDPAATIKAALKAFMVQAERSGDVTKTTAGVKRKCLEVIKRLDSGGKLSWQDWHRLSTLSPAKALVDAAEPIREAGARHHGDPRLHRDLADAITLVFDLARRALDAYRKQKDELGVIDFVDQECLALDALTRPDVRRRLKGELDLVLVDEFQDTSPIQLAVFLKLAAIAKRSVWVGDQKQCIFGFRNADPVLMDGAIEAILGDEDPETLSESWRSRPELVGVTSDMFAKAFPRHDIPPERVRLEPHHKDEPSGLGPILERWLLAKKNQDIQAASLATAVRDFLASPENRVRDRETGKARAAKPGDIAILCRTNRTCSRVADCLASAGLRASLARAGLIATPEARIVLAGLRLWSNPGDTLAAAEMGRFLQYPEDPDGWLSAILARPGKGAFNQFDTVKSVLDRAKDQESVSLEALDVLDAVIEATDVRRLCARWGEGANRLANLDMLRAAGVTYLSGCGSRGTAPTVTGLINHFAALGDGETDARASTSDENAVVVSTWHKAKGLEWPVVVLYGIDKETERLPLGVNVGSDVDGTRLDDPLAGRWIRYWPNPYQGATKKTQFHGLVADSEPATQADVRERRETLRLLYVGWTRARDRVVVAGKPEAMHKGGMFAELADDEGSVLREPDEADPKWCGRDVKVRLAELSDPVTVKATPDPAYDPSGPVDHPPAWASPSSVESRGQVTEEVHLGDSFAVQGSPDVVSLGNAVHGFLAADWPGTDRPARLAMATGLLSRWGVGGALEPEALLDMADRLHKWAETHWPGATWRREWPLLHRLANGTKVRGESDLVLETSDGLVVIDHKSFHGGGKAFAGKAAGFAGQLASYAAALEAATGKSILGMYIHMPLLGTIFKVSPVESSQD